MMQLSYFIHPETASRLWEELHRGRKWQHKHALSHAANGMKRHPVYENAPSQN